MENIYKIKLPTPFFVGPVNVFLLTGDTLTLVDTGLNTPESMTALTQQLGKLGYRINDLQQIVITHAHHDHFGLAGKLVQKSQAITLMHPNVVPWLVNYNQTFEKYMTFFEDLFRQARVSEKFDIKTKAARPNFNTMVDSAPVGKVLASKEVIRAGSDNWQVIFTPGHAGSSICLYQPDKKLLISGDHLLPTISSNPLLEPPEKQGIKREPSLPGYIKSLQITGSMDIKTVLPGHGENIYNHRQVVEKRLGQFASRQEHVLGLVNMEPKTAFQICMNMFPKIEPGELYLGLFEAFNHLDVLVDLGKIIKAQNREVDYFYK